MSVPRALFLLLPISGAVIASCADRTTSAPQSGARPSVILIVVDTLRRDHLGCYGYARDVSPAIDALAADGVRYEHAISQAPWTTPSIGSLLTSHYPTTLGIHDERSVVPDGEVLLSEALKAHGYATGAVISHSFCSSRWNFGQGFDVFDESNVQGHAAVTSEGVTARAIDFIETHAAEPFFLWVHYFDTHFAYVEHDDFAAPRPEGYEGPIESGMPFRRLAKLRARLTPADVDELVRLYDSEIAYTDHHLGLLLDRLRELGLYESSLIVFTADHGEEFLDHGRLGHAKTLYEELIHVPLIVKVPRGEPGVVDRAVELLGVYPTVFDALDLPLGHDVDGESFLSGGEPRSTIFSETAKGGLQRMVMDGGFKLVQRVGSDVCEMFDVGADPAEQQDLAPAGGPRFSALKKVLESWGAELAARAPAGQTIDLTDREIKNLESLGYGGDADEDE